MTDDSSGLDSLRRTGKTIYAQPSVGLSKRIEIAKQLANQTTAQVVLEALDFWTRLPPESHVALRRLELHGGPSAVSELIARLSREIIASTQPTSAPEVPSTSR